MLKANTIEQFHILKHLQENFFVDSLKIELVDRNRVQITDCTGETADFIYNKEKGIVEMM